MSIIYQLIMSWSSDKHSFTSLQVVPLTNMAIFIIGGQKIQHWSFRKKANVLSINMANLKCSERRYNLLVIKYINKYSTVKKTNCRQIELLKNILYFIYLL